MLLVCINGVMNVLQVLVIVVFLYLIILCVMLLCSDCGREELYSFGSSFFDVVVLRALL